MLLVQTLLVHVWFPIQSDIHMDIDCPWISIEYPMHIHCIYWTCCWLSNVAYPLHLSNLVYPWWYSTFATIASIQACISNVGYPIMYIIYSLHILSTLQPCLSIAIVHLCTRIAQVSNLVNQWHLSIPRISIVQVSNHRYPLFMLLDTLNMHVRAAVGYPTLYIHCTC